MSDGDRTAIAGGVAPGEEVITEGLDKLQPGMQVTVRTANRPEAKGAEQ
jgi:hypothetical protein